MNWTLFLEQMRKQDDEEAVIYAIALQAAIEGGDESARLAERDDWGIKEYTIAALTLRAMLHRPISDANTSV